MNAPRRRGFCPGLSAPMATGDGLLARLTPTGATIALEAFADVCAAARTHGNGIVEITSRGSIQVRGLTGATALKFATAVAALGIAASEGVPVLVNPLRGLDPGETFDAGALAADLRGSLAAAPFASRLAAKVSVIVDGGGGLHLDGVAADVRLRAVAGRDTNFHIALAGDAADAVAIGEVGSSRAVEVAMQLLGALAAMGPQTRMRDAVRGEGLSALKSALSNRVMLAPAPPVRPAAQPIGRHLLRSDRAAVGVALPFGHADSEMLQRLVNAARRAGATGLRTAPGRALILLGLESGAAQSVVADAAALGFIVEPGDPRRRVIACSGAPICAAGEIPARIMAPAVARALAGMPESVGVVHVSGCAKGCAHPAPAPVAVIGRDGACDVLLDGVLARTVPAEELPKQIEAIARSRMEPAHG